MVDSGCDTPIESFVVHSPFVEHVEHDCKGRQALFLIVPRLLAGINLVVWLIVLHKITTAVGGGVSVAKAQLVRL